MNPVIDATLVDADANATPEPPRAEPLRSLADVLGVPEIGNPPVANTVEIESDVKIIAQAILNSSQYRASILRRIIMDELPPAVESLLWQYGYGKPTETVKHEGEINHRVTRIERVIVGITDGRDSTD